MKDDFVLIKEGDHLCGRFQAMASPCELLFDMQDDKQAFVLMRAALKETRRIEHKYSRYLRGNLMHSMNNSLGKPIAIDSETSNLLAFANTCFEMSQGKFDITSGILRRAWKFDGSNKLPSKSQVEELLPYIGWQKIKYKENELIVPPNFELDFGGIGKEYAVNKVAQIMSIALPESSVLINFGGDIQVTQPRNKSPYWQVGIENPSSKTSTAVVNIAQGGLATSGDANRFLLKDGVRYSHVLDPHTGFPVIDAPRSVTVASDHCIEAGLMATLSLLQGKNAEVFLEEQGMVFWSHR